MAALRQDVARRLIPAHAGSTVVYECVVWEAGAHPRSRGEHQARLTLVLGWWGSSPLTRGAHNAFQAQVGRGGLIPAHAGSTLTISCWRAASRAHPRSRGEHLGLQLGQLRTEGSSPLTRGAREGEAGDGLTTRLIPAHAGSTRRVYRRSPRLRAHPRSRGEHTVDGLGKLTTMGSSPLTRGAHQVRLRQLRNVGLIPAHAGSTCQPKPNQKTRAAHPRSRGEHRCSARGGF